jgi:purine-cytosine permease-like protein
MKKRKDKVEDPPVRPQLYISVMLVGLMLVLAFMGQWDWVVAVFIGLLIGNGLTGLKR